MVSLDLSKAVFAAIYGGTTVYGKYEDGVIHSFAPHNWPDFFFPRLRFDADVTYTLTFTYDPGSPHNAGSGRDSWAFVYDKTVDPHTQYTSGMVWDQVNSTAIADGDVVTTQIGPGLGVFVPEPGTTFGVIFETHRDGALASIEIDPAPLIESGDADDAYYIGPPWEGAGEGGGGGDEEILEPADDPEGFTFTPELALTILDKKLNRAPTVAMVMVTGGWPELPIDFYIDDVLVWTGESTDSEGALGPVTIGILNVGTGVGVHTIEARQVYGSTVLTGSDTYTLVKAMNPMPSGMAPDTRAVDVPGALQGDVRRWVFQDMLPWTGIGSYILPRNPISMTSPHVEKALTARHTTARSSGMFHVYEAGHVPKEWTLTGYCATEEERLALQAYRDINRRFWVIDHRNRAWKVVVGRMAFKPKLRQNFNGELVDSYDYEITLIVLDQNWRAPVPAPDEGGGSGGTSTWGDTQEGGFADTTAWAEEHTGGGG